MRYTEIENQIEFLLGVALQKCGNVQDAEDLCQDVLLASCAYLSKGEMIEDMRGWMLTVLNRKFYDKLRQKYRRPIIGVAEDYELIDEREPLVELLATEEAERVRRELAYLTKIYREVLVRHYMRGESVAVIAEELGIPEGTVKSRLYLGRNQMKRGMEEMEKYTKESYMPVTLKVNNSGSWGMNGEPGSLVNDDLMAQNLLWLAYNKPVTAEELSRSIGIPAAYVEPVIKRLVDGELMKQIGNKYYTDFIIYTLEDEERHIPAQKQFVKDHFTLIWKNIEEGLTQVREKEYYQKLSFDQRNSLELYMAYYCLDNGFYATFVNVFDAPQIFPDRPNGGKWNAFGYVHFKEFDVRDHREMMAHAYSGNRWERFENFAGAKEIELHIYGAEGFPCYPYDKMLDESLVNHRKEDIDEVLLKLLHVIREGMNPEEVGFNAEYLKAIPWLKRCKILTGEEMPTVNIPVLTGEEARGFYRILWGILDKVKVDIKEPFAEFVKDKKVKIPAHLNSVPLQKQYQLADHAMVMAAIREAMKRGRLYDGDYDNDSNGVNQPPAPMVMIVEK